MDAYIAKRERETGRTNPMYTNLNWHGMNRGPFESSQEAYDSMYIGSINNAQQLQEKEKEEQVENK
jgi:hypothetical protein